MRAGAGGSIAGTVNFIPEITTATVSYTHLRAHET